MKSLPAGLAALVLAASGTSAAQSTREPQSEQAETSGHVMDIKGFDPYQTAVTPPITPSQRLKLEECVWAYLGIKEQRTPQGNVVVLPFMTCKRNDGAEWTWTYDGRKAGWQLSSHVGAPKNRGAPGDPFPYHRDR